MHRLPNRFSKNVLPDSNHERSRQSYWNIQNPWKTYTRKIILSGSLVTIPMVAFTGIISWAVFTNIFGLGDCPYTEFCYDVNTREMLRGSNYYIDFSVGRIAFIASLSSAISLTLVGTCMAMYGFIAARQLLEASRLSVQSEKLPSPYNTTTLIRLLNAEITLLWDLFSRYFRQIFRRRSTSRQKKTNRGVYVIRGCAIVFGLALFSSILIQVASVYFHIVIEGVSATRLSADKNTSRYQYSRRLAPWCFDAEESVRTRNNNAFWGCAINATDYDNESTITTTRTSLVASIRADLDPHVLYYTDKQDLGYAVIRPAIVDTDVDWTGTSFAVSTKCSAVPYNTCKMGDPYDRGEMARSGVVTAFECPNIFGGPGVSGNVTADAIATWFKDWHQNINQSTPFKRHLILGPESNRTRLNATTQNPSSPFSNPWHWLVQLRFPSEPSDLPLEFRQSDFLWNVHQILTLSVLSCTTTVWDVSISVANQKVLDLLPSKSNGSMAGIVSMPSVSGLSFSAQLQTVQLKSTQNLTTPEAFVKSFELAISKAFASWLVVHTVPTPVGLAQRRVTKIVTRLPVIAFWLLVTANILFALFGLILAVLAALATSPEVHQVHTRLSTAGLAAGLFDWQHSQRAAKSDSELFIENTTENNSVDCRKRIGVRCTAFGGAEFVTHDVLGISTKDNEQSRPLQTRQTL